MYFWSWREGFGHRMLAENSRKLGSIIVICFGHIEQLFDRFASVFESSSGIEHSRRYWELVKSEFSKAELRSFISKSAIPEDRSSEVMFGCSSKFSLLKAARIELPDYVCGIIVSWLEFLKWLEIVRNNARLQYGEDKNKRNLVYGTRFALSS